jgi:AcrR family transcriptional regulator
VAAARESFAKQGYDATSLRGIATKAGVDPALVRRFFGSKENLLVEALKGVMSPEGRLAGVLADDPDRLGERLVGYMFSVWEKSPNREILVGMIRSACTNARGARLLRDFISGEILARIGAGLDPEEAKLRASLVGSQIVGLALCRYVVKIEPIASASPEMLTATYAPVIQGYLTGPLPRQKKPQKKRKT